MGKKRPFATGSKPGPDAIDHYLESQSFYRKHAARDSSSLFRAVSEQVFDIQNYHDEFRQRCACYMEIHSKDYAKEVDKNFHNYVSNLRKHRTSGTLLEVRVMSRMYKRNVFLFEPNSSNTQCTQREYVHDDSYFEEPIRLFYSQKDRHFDAIYPMEIVELMANTQSIVHEILYKDVLKLPDVMFATEIMLYDSKGETTVPLAEDESKYKTVNDEICSFDTAEDTNCVLKDPATCHFHNQKDFEELVKKNQDSITIINRSDDPGRLKVYKPVDGYLYLKEKSCVRQLLDENITPFPFKVAKALDQSIYRNIEFENWQDSRKESRQKWLDIDDKFIIYENDPRFHPVPYYDQGYGVDEYSCDQKYIEAEGTKGTINSLAGFDIFQPQQIQPSRDQVDHLVMPIQTNFNPNYRQHNGGYRHTFPNRGGRGGYNPNNNSRVYTNSHHNNYNQQREQYQNNNHENGYHHNQANQQHHHQQQQQLYNQAPQNGYVQPQYAFNDTISPPPVYQPVVQYDTPTQNYQQIQNAYPSQGYNQNPYANFVPPQPDFSVPPPQLPIIVANHQSEPILNLQSEPVVSHQSEPVMNEVVNGDCLNLIREGELGLQNVNFDHGESIEPNGSDLPTDAATLQFYFNLGLRYFKATGLRTRTESVSIPIENTQQGDQKQECLTDTANNNVEIPQPVAQISSNTPAMQSNQNINNNNCQNGNREQYNNNNGIYNNNLRRNQNQNRDDYYQKGNQNGAYNQKNGTHNQNKNGNYNYIKNGHQNGKGRNGFNNNQVHRKEIQFNSNVKNVHKVDSNPQRVNLQNERTPVANGKQEPPHEKSPDSVNTDSTGYGSEAQQVMTHVAKQITPLAFQKIIPQVPQTAAFVQQVMLEPQVVQQFVPQVIQQVMSQDIPRVAQHALSVPPPQVTPQMEQSQQQRPFYQAPPAFIPQQQQQQQQIPIQQPQMQQQNQQQSPQHYMFFFHNGNGQYVQQYPIYYQPSPPQNYVNNSPELQNGNGNEIARYNGNAFSSPQTYTPILYQQPPQRAQYYYAEHQVAQITSYNETEIYETPVEVQQSGIEVQQNGIEEEENDIQEIVTPGDEQQSGNKPANANE